MNPSLRNISTACLLVAAMTAGAQAASITYYFTMEYTPESTLPSGSGPWGSIEFTDEGVEDGKVKMTITSMLSVGEHFKVLAFNFVADDDSESHVESLEFEYVAGSKVGNFIDPVFTVNKDGVTDGEINPARGFDVLVDVKNSASGDNDDDDDKRFDLNNSIMYLLSSDLLDLEVSMFDAGNVGGQGNGPTGLGAAAHVGGTPNDGSAKLKNGEPIPTPAALPAGLALLLYTATRRRRAA